LIAEANQAFGTDLLSITLYGSGAEGRLRETSDLNLIFVLKRFERDALKSFSLKLLFAVGDGTRSGG
jgi:predicted nucleotidyltransferase